MISAISAFVLFMAASCVLLAMYFTGAPRRRRPLTVFYSVVFLFIVLFLPDIIHISFPVMLIIALLWVLAVWYERHRNENHIRASGNDATTQDGHTQAKQRYFRRGRQVVWVIIGLIYVFTILAGSILARRLPDDILGILTGIFWMLSTATIAAWLIAGVITSILTFEKQCHSGIEIELGRTGVITATILTFIVGWSTTILLFAHHLTHGPIHFAGIIISVAPLFLLELQNYGPSFLRPLNYFNCVITKQLQHE